MARHQSEAERLRAHGEAFKLSLELGCTPKEAEREIARIKARERDRAAADRLAAKLAAPIGPARRERRETDQPWMMRD